MEKVLIFNYYEESYYEPSLRYGFYEDRATKFKEYDMGSTEYTIRNIKDFKNMYKEVVVELEDYLDIKLSDFNGIVRMLDVCDEKQFSNIYNNYKYLDELQTKAYTYNVSDEFNKKVWNNSNGYGDFRQTLIPFNNIELLIEEPTKFNKICFDKVSDKLKKIFIVGNEEVRKTQLKANINMCEANVERLKKDLVRYEKTLKENKQELKGLE